MLTQKLKKGFAVFTASLVAISTVPFAGLTSAAADEVAPKDTVTLVKVSDGTHNGDGTETFINSKNGFRVADDSTDDGVVASGDIVTYKYDLSVVAGKARTLEVKFTQPDNGALNIADFKNTAMNGNVIVGKYSGDKWVYNIPRGASGHVTATFSIRANDTKGNIVDGNVITATLTNTSVKTYEYTSKTEPVTVVSTPFADLTIDAVNSRNISRTYNQKSKYGTFNIEPAALKIDGYSDNGLTTSGEWHTDIDVSSFPSDTKWYFDNKPVTPQNGVINDIRSSGNKVLKYELPESAMPSEDDPKRVYEIHLEPYADSFKVGDVDNPKDAGSGEGVDYDTSKHTNNGVLVHAPMGVNTKNNNYATAIWRYDPPVKGSIWRYDVYVPRNSNEALYDKGNIYWNNRSDYYQQGQSTYYQRDDLKYITNDNDMYSTITIDSDGIEGTFSTDKIVAGDTWDSNGVTGDYRDSHYDTKRDVVVTYNGTPIDISKYTIQWRRVPDGVISLDDDVKGASKWISSNKAPNTTVNQYRVIFKDNAFDNTTGIVRVNVPVKARNDYNPNTDSHKLLNSKGVLAIQNNSTANGVTGNSYNSMTYNQVLKFPSVPNVTANIDATTKAPEVVDGKYSVNFTVMDRVSGAHTVYGYNATRTLTFDDAYDVSTFNIAKANGWKVESTDGNRVVLKRDGFDLSSASSLGDVQFNIKTKMNLNVKDSLKVDGTVREELSLDYPALANISSGNLKSNDSAIYSFDTMREVSSVITADSHKVEIGDDIGWRVNVSADQSGFSQSVLLPFNRDKTLVDQINKVNDSTISIDDGTGKDTTGYMDGIGRTKVDGKYRLKSITLERYASDTTVDLKNGSTGDSMELPVDYNTGRVNISSISDHEFDPNNDIAALVISSNKNLSDVQGTGVVAHIVIEPIENNIGNDYVTWLGVTQPYGKNMDNMFTKNELAKEVAWPDYTSVVASSITGVVWNDNNSNGAIDDGEKKYSGVSVRLQKLGDNGEYQDAGPVVQTGSDGSYKFDGLHSGKYRVVLPNVEREDGTDKVIKVNGSTGDSAKDGDLKQGNTNRFNVLEPTLQTYSYGKYKRYSTNYTDINLGVGDDKRDINYGFREPVADIKLDKSVATVTDNGNDTSTVEWDITVKNNGNEDIDGAVLNDRLSSSVAGVESSLGYVEEVETSIPGILLDIPGNLSQNRGVSLVATDQGLFAADSSTKTFTKLDLPESSSILGMQTLGAPNSIDRSDLYVVTEHTTYRYDFTNKKLINTANLPEKIKTLYPVKEQISGRNTFFVLTEDGNAYQYDNIRNSFDKLQGIDNGVKQIFGGVFATVVVDSSGSVFWKLNSGGMSLTKTGVEGEVLSYIDNNSNMNYSILVTTNGVFILSKQNGNLVERANITGDFISASKDIVQTTDGLFTFYLNYDTFKYEYRKIELEYGEVIRNTSSGELFAIKNDKTYLLTISEGQIKDRKEVYGLIGNFVDLLRYYNYYYGFNLCVTDAGIFIVYNDGSIKLLSKITGEYLSANKQNFGGSYAFIMTSDGLFNYNESGMPGMGTISDENGDVVRRITHSSSIFHKDQSISPTSQKTEDDLTTRTYNLPKLLKGKSMTLHIKGVVQNDAIPTIVGNQAWVTSPLTPREGITKKDPSILTTGDNMDPGVPDKFTLPTVDTFDKNGIASTNTVKLNRDIDNDESISDDLADQTPALIPANKSGTKLDNDYKLHGYAWYDLDKNGLRDDNAPAANIKVTVTDTNIPELKYETTTDNNGYWEIDGLGNKWYSVHYDVVGHKHNDKIWTATVVNDSDDSLNSDIDKSGYALEDPHSLSPNEEVDATVDAGLMTVDASVRITKGWHHDGDAKTDNDTVYGDKELVDDTTALDTNPSGFGENETARVDDGDYDPRTQAYSFNVVNNGQSPLKDVKLTDETLEGNKAKLGTKLVYYPDGKTPDINTNYKLDENGYIVDQDGNNVTMAPGSMFIGAVDVPFTTENPSHNNKLSVTANALFDGDVAGSVNDSDSLKTKYEYKPNRFVKIKKVGDQSDGNNKPLEGVSFNIERETGENEYKNIGTYVTSEDGTLDVKLDAGTYRITETSTADGYRLPDTSWKLNIGYDESGDVTASIGGEGVPLAEVSGVGPDESTWCDIVIHNKQNPSFFSTGKTEAAILIAVSVGVAIGSAYVIKRRRDKKLD